MLLLTGCFNAKLDVFNCCCELAFELLVVWLSLVQSSGNLCLINCLKLFWPQTASAASDDKCQNSKLFLLNFCLNFIIFLFILSLYGSIYAEINSLFNKLNNMFGFCSFFISFCYTYEKNCWKKQKFTFQKCRKNLHNHSEKWNQTNLDGIKSAVIPGIFLALWSQNKNIDW